MTTRCSDGKRCGRRAEEAVAAACGDKLVRCPSCNFPSQVEDFKFKDVLRFSCPNLQCLKESCRKCGGQWKLHAGKTCEQLEADEIRTRVRFEERMTEALVRKCANCSAGLVKSDGCNHMTCRCGSHMCYVCREPMDLKTHHFCQCGLSRGLPCTVCSHCQKCLQNSDPTADDDRVIQEIQKEAEAELNKNGPRHSGKRVGPIA